MHAYFLGSGKTEEDPEETHATWEEPVKLHTEINLSSGLNQGVWRCVAAMLPAVPLCCPNVHVVVLKKCFKFRKV